MSPDSRFRAAKPPTTGASVSPTLARLPQMSPSLSPTRPPQRSTSVWVASTDSDRMMNPSFKPAKGPAASTPEPPSMTAPARDTSLTSPNNPKDPNSPKYSTSARLMNNPLIQCRFPRNTPPKPSIGAHPAPPFQKESDASKSPSPSLSKSKSATNS